MPATRESELIGLIGEDGVIQLAETFGGLRLYVPSDLPAEHEIVLAIGLGPARRLCERYSPDVIRVPLARELRAVSYRRQGKSNAQIARALGLTETGIDKMFKRLAATEGLPC